MYVKISRKCHNHEAQSHAVSILYKSIADRYRPVRVADGPMTARHRVIKNASLGLPKASKEGEMRNN